MSEIQTATPAIEAEPLYSYDELSKAEWAARFGVPPTEVIGLVRTAMAGIIESDPIIQKSGLSSETGNARRRRLEEANMEASGGTKNMKLTLSADIQGRVTRLVAVRNTEPNKGQYLKVKELNTLILKLNFREMITLVTLLQKQHPEWFRESDYANSVGKKSWWLKAEYKGVFLQAAKPYTDAIIARRPPFGKEKLPTHLAFETNTRALAGWGVSGYEDVLDGRMD